MPDPAQPPWRLLLIALGALLPAAAFAQVERFAVVVGNDVGQPPDVALAYAETDAARMAGVLQEVGGVRPENLVLLRGQDAATVQRTLIAVNERVRTASRQTVLVVYYSGHADAGALHLGGTQLDLSELEQLVRGSAASFRLLVVDACRSGALTRVKGGAPIPPFDIQLGEEAETRMRHLLAANPKDKHGANRSRLSDAGLDPQVERRRFARYQERFGVASEVID